MTVTYAQTIASQTAQQVRDAVLLPALAVAGSTVGGAPTSSPDRGIVEVEAVFLSMEQQLRAGVALSISATTALQAGDDWVDAAATWYQVPSNQGPGNTPGGIGRFVATFALWSIPLVCAPTVAPLTIAPGQTLQLQANGGQVFNLSLPAGASPIVLNSGNSYKATAPFIARAAGTQAGNVTPGTIAAIITGPAGLAVDLTGTQVNTTGAIDQETSPALLVRCYGRWGTLAAGWTALAFDYLIPSFAPDITRWNVDTANPFGPGSVGVVLAQAGGAASGPSTSPGTDCYAVYQGLAALGVKPLGTGPLFVAAASVVTLTINAELATDGSNPNLVANATAAMAALMSLMIGPMVLTPDLVIALLRGAAFDGVEVPQYDSGSPGSITLALNVPGFGGEVVLVDLDFSANASLAVGQIFGLTLNIATALV